ncbi:MAG: GNAT family N-acetyltransferase, partial [Candidatus Delongbacteria bacterium]|nr:GNAT family N-acetyltransferase [Candidatus Delongbacteria bacterium]
KNMKEGLKILNEFGVAAYKTPEQAVRAFMTLVEYSRNLETLYETPRDIPVEFSLDRKKIKEEFKNIVRNNLSILSEENSKKLLAAYDINVTAPVAVKSEDEAVAVSEKTGYPVVFKIDSPQITHKTDAGGVITDINSGETARLSYKKIISNVSQARPDAEILGITVQKMIRMKDSVEIILGIKRDNVFGTVILVGSGGVTAELYSDTSLGFPPLNERLARRMLEDLKIWPLLKGYRGKPPVDIDKLIEVMIRLSYLAADYPEITELDINPLIAGSEGVWALDARVAVDITSAGKYIEKYQHLALRPYPEEFVKKGIELDGHDITLRPIKPEDEPLWLELLGSCSKESIYSRFRYFFQWSSHDVATRFCYIDYDREIGIVAETVEGGKRKLLGVGRLISDPERHTVEYAILITDKWQNKDLGGIITDFCIEIAKKWGMKKIYAQTTTDNHRMIALFRKRGFDITGEERNDSTIEVEKDLN